MMNSDKPTNEFRKWFILPTENEKKKQICFYQWKNKASCVSERKCAEYIGKIWLNVP